MLVSTAGITNCGPSSPTRAKAEAWAGTSPMHSYPERAQGQEAENKLQMPIPASFEEKKRLSGSQCLFSSIQYALNIIANTLLNIGAASVFFFFLREATMKPIYKQIRLFKKGVLCTYNRSSCFRSWKAPLSMMLTWLSSRCLEPKG